MRLSTSAHYSQGYLGLVDEVVEMEKAGIDTVWFAESYGVDSVSAMGYFTAKTQRVEIASGILNIFSRTPAALAQTAAGLDILSQGRFMLGLGASGPQVVEGLHGQPYTAPVTRLRETVEICRALWRREEKLQYDGTQFQIPLPTGEGTGLGKPLKLINRPLREDIPIALATLGHKSVSMTAEIADAWLPAFFMVDKADEVWGDALRQGRQQRSADRPPLRVFAGGTVAIGENLEPHRDMARPRVALYVGGMGARDVNFYNRIFRQYGFEAEAETIQDLYLAGRKSEAEAAIPQAYLDATSLIGPEGFVRERLAAYQDFGVTDLHVSFLGTTTAERVRHCDRLKNLIEKVS